MKLTKQRTANLAAKPAAGFSVDASAGLLTNVALMTVGDALGYWFTIDAVTLTTAQAAIERRGGQLRVYPTHRHSGCTHGTCDDSDDIGSELNYAAYAEGITVKGDQLVAATLKFYDTFRQNYQPQFDTIIELAAKTPDLLGLSTEPVYHCAYVGKDGVEYSARPEGVDLAHELPAMRVDEIFAAAFGALPATNSSLFAKLSAKFVGKQKGLRRLLRDLTAALDRAPEKPAELSPPAPIKETLTAQPIAPSPVSPLMKIIADLQAKFAGDKKRLGQAMILVGETPAEQQANLTVAVIEAQLATVDLTAARAETVDLTGKLTAANNQVAQLTTDLAAARKLAGEWEGKFNTLKSSGLARGLDLGAPTSGGVSLTANPYAKGSINLTAQIRLEKADPARAAALKAEAAAAK